MGGPYGLIVATAVGNMRSETYILNMVNRGAAFKASILTIFLCAILLTLVFSSQAPAAAIEEEDSFAIVVLPDTQLYSRDHPEIFRAQTQWIVDNKDALNIVFVTHEGDLVQSYNSETEWGNASEAMSVLDGEVPYGVLPGNHDFRADNHYISHLVRITYPPRSALRGLATFLPIPDDRAWDASRHYNTHFPYSRYEAEPWYGGHHGDRNNNNYQLFSAGDMDFVALHLQYDPSDGVLDWADGVLDSYPNRKAIVTTHSLLEKDGTRSSIGNGVFDALKDNDNVFLMLCGHIGGEGNRSDIVGGREIHQLRADYQWRPHGGDGWLRIMTFVPSQERIYVETYSPYLDKYETDKDSQFVLDYKTGVVADESPVGLDEASPARLGGTVAKVILGLGLGVFVMSFRARDSSQVQRRSKEG